MKKTNILLLLILIALSIFSCKKDEVVNKDKQKYISKIFENDELIYDFIYEGNKLMFVYKYSSGSIDTFFIESGIEIKDELFANKIFEYDEEGKCTKITYYKSLPDSIFYFLNLFYESDNLSKIDCYGGDGNYAGNITYEYDTSPNALYVLNRFVEPNFYNYWKFQPNHCIEQNSDGENEDGYALIKFAYSFQTQFPIYDEIAIFALYSYYYTYTEEGLPAQAIYHSRSEPEILNNLRFVYVEL